MGRDDLDASAGIRLHRAATEVNLVAVVLRWIVAGRDHDAGIGIEVAHGKGGHRCGQLLWQSQGLATGCGDNRGGIAVKIGGAVAGIATNDHGEVVAHNVLQMRNQASGGTDDRGTVHAGLTSCNDTAKTCSAEFEWPGETAFQLGNRIGVGGLGFVVKRRELGGGGLVRIVGDPIGDGGL